MVSGCGAPEGETEEVQEITEGSRLWWCLGCCDKVLPSKMMRIPGVIFAAHRILAVRVPRCSCKHRQTAGLRDLSAPATRPPVSSNK